MDDRDLISVIIVNYNTFELTCNCIRSVFEKTDGVPFEVILVDNHSQECDPDLFLEAFPGVTLVKSTENKGFAAGNNLGIEQASGNFILLLNSDAELKNNAIFHAYQRLRGDASIGVIGGKLLFPNGSIQYSANSFPSLKKELFLLFRLQKILPVPFSKNFLLGSHFDYEEEKEVDTVWGAFFMFRKDDLNLFPNGKLQEDFFMYGEDLQWCYYFKNVVQKRIIFFPDAQVIHHYQGSGSFQNRAEKLVERVFPNRGILLNKIKGPVYKKIYFFILLLRYYTTFQPVPHKRLIVRAILKQL